MTELSDHKPTGVEPTGAITLMVVEPDVLSRMVIADYLRNCGYRVIEGVRGEDVFTVLDSGGVIDVVLSEISLSGEMDGFGLATKIRERNADIDVILVRGTSSAADKVGSLCEDGPLDKPYHPQEVVRRINLLRERRRTFGQ